LLFLYRLVLEIDLPLIENVERAKRPKRVPAVFTREKARRVLANIRGTHLLMASLLYGAGLRLMECVHLRVKDLDFQYKQITVRDGKGERDRRTMLPQPLIEPLKRHLRRVKLQHEDDVRAGYGAVYLPYALERKYPAAPTDWLWQYVFPSNKLSTDPRTGVTRRHHTSEDTFQRVVARANEQPLIQVVLRTNNHSDYASSSRQQNGGKVRPRKKAPNAKTLNLASYN